MLFSNRPPTQIPPLVIKSNLTYESIKRVEFIKFLGVYFDQNLTFKKHISLVTSRLASLSSLFYRLKDTIPEFALKCIYNAHVSSILNYCNVIWANTFHTHLIPLIRIQKRIIRNIARTDFFAHTQPLFTRLKILNIEAIGKQHLAIYFFKNRDNIIAPLTANHNYPTRSRNVLRPAIHRNTLYEKSFLYKAPQYWNQLRVHFPPDIMNDITLTQFKKRVKIMLLQSDDA